ncbi:MAG TPA: tetratricopeptide repeat protein [Bdellovibrionota bacterium]
MRLALWFSLLSFLLSPIVHADESAAQVLFEAGMKRYEEGDLKEAQKQFEKAIALDRNLDKAHFQLASVFLANKKLDLALGELKRIKTDTSIKEMVPAMEGDIYLRKKKWRNALVIWDIFPDSNPDLKALKFRGQARAFEGLKKHKEAADAWTSFLSVQNYPTRDLFERISVNRIGAKEKDSALKFCGESDLLQKQKSFRLLCKAHVYHASFLKTASKEDKKSAAESLNEILADDGKNPEANALLEEWKLGDR